MGNQDMITEATVACDSKCARLRTQLFLSRRTYVTSTTANPGINHPACTNFDPTSVRTDRHHCAGNFVSQRQRQFATFGQVEPLAAAHVEESVSQMQVTVTDTTGLNPDKHLGSNRVRGFERNPLERLAKPGQLIASHRIFVGTELNRRHLGFVFHRIDRRPLPSRRKKP